MEQNTDMNQTLIDADYKDESPLKTVEKIKEILSRYGIETDESWFESSVPYCYSIRVSVVGTGFGVNGKGLTKEFALASGYGELMERLQLGYVGKVQKDGNYSTNDGLNEIIPAKVLLEQNRGWYEILSQRLYDYTGTRETPEAILQQFADDQGMVTATTYYNITKGEKTYFPTGLRKRVYSTNGCAAGNTMEEALVQGLSELVERYHHMRIITEDICLPDIPEEALQKYKVAYDIITYIRSQGFRVFVKDCSLGGKFPVVCVCFIDEKTGRYHTHFGAYPIFEIALERALTESFQGRSLRSVASFEDFTYKRSDVYSIANISNEIAKGTWEKLTSFFVGEPRFPFREDVAFTGTNNKEVLKECIEYFSAQGYEILVRDGSCMGFPTYHILVPGYSEVYIHRISQKLDDHRYLSYAVKSLRNPSQAGFEDLLGLLMHVSQMNKFPKTISGVHGFLAGAKLSANISGAEESQLMAASLGYAYYAMGKHADLLKCLQSMIPNSSGEDTEYLICLKRYLSLKQHKYEPDQIRSIVEFFHPQTAPALYEIIEGGGNPLEKFTLRCDLSCGSDCKLYGVCSQKRTDELTGLINRLTGALDFDSFTRKIRELTV